MEQGDSLWGWVRRSRRFYMVGVRMRTLAILLPAAFFELRRRPPTPFAQKRRDGDPGPAAARKALRAGLYGTTKDRALIQDVDFPSAARLYPNHGLQRLKPVGTLIR